MNARFHQSNWRTMELIIYFRKTDGHVRHTFTHVKSEIHYIYIVEYF
jgi:hypothetical protein